MAIFGVGGGFIAKYAALAMKEYATASTIAEEIISSVRTAQAFGTQEKLAKLYDDNLVAAQRTGYKQQFAGAIMISVMFFCVYGFYGLGTCKINYRQMLTVVRGRITATGRQGVNRWRSTYCALRRHHWRFLTRCNWSSY